MTLFHISNNIIIYFIIKLVTMVTFVVIVFPRLRSAHFRNQPSRRTNGKTKIRSDRVKGPI